ncbi:hypothetical protein VQ7734_00404 [Vibrio quintilis]|uniref:Uncharacterized protein n=1 Tax=Vibrio quintilis TaxID=1117707 RepID=A0A1M7YPW9_9VIBR|nr:hypothetical protein VQ7734_00404 [Vibrio quintilis]
MLKRRIQSKHLWRITSTVRRKRKLANNKNKVFDRHRTFINHLSP